MVPDPTVLLSIDQTVTPDPVLAIAGIPTPGVFLGLWTYDLIRAGPRHQRRTTYSPVNTDTQIRVLRPSRRAPSSIREASI